jgi:hypothetical protein
VNSFWAQRTPGERRMLVIGLIVVAICVPLVLFPGGASGKKLLSAREARQQYESKLKEKAQLESDNERIKPLRSKKVAGVTKETLSVRFTSEFGKTVPFFYRVEDPAGRLVVEKFNLTASDPKSRTVDVDAQIALFTKSDAAAPTAAGAGA